jgi:hypothetical protein
VIGIYNIIIFGTGSAADGIVDIFGGNVNIVAFADNNNSKCGGVFREKEIISPKRIKEFGYDYIVIASQFNEEIYNQLIDMNIKKEVIFQYVKFLDMIYNHFEVMLLSYFKRDIDKIETIITGISYAMAGLNASLLKKVGCNFAIDSQDLFYDYHVFKYILENFNHNLKYGIIGLCYYSFQYDMSLSAMQNKVMLYYPTLKTSHNFKLNYDFDKEYDINKDIADKIIKKNQSGHYDFCVEIKSLADFNNKESIGKKQAEIDCDKNYPETVKENIQIFKDYLKLLNEHNIKPIVVVFPASKYYTKYFSERIEKEFHGIIDELKKEYDFQYIDHFRLDVFKDDEFWDVSHLNPKGAEKFTQILNKEINW